jgi:tetratricopeptide (TPR) repeat protein
MVSGGMSLEELVTAAMDAAEAGELNRGKALALLAIDKHAGSVAPWVVLSMAESGLGHTQAAVDAAKQALRLDSSNAVAWSTLADVYAHSQDPGLYEQAVAAYDRALALDPGDGEAWNMRGVMLKFRGRYRESLASFDKALALDPENGAAWKNRQITLLEADPARSQLLSLAFKIAVERRKGQIAKHDLEPTVLRAFGGNACLDADLVMSFAVVADLMRDAPAPIMGISKKGMRSIVQFCEVNLVLARHLGDDELIEVCERLHAEIAAAAPTG